MDCFRTCDIRGVYPAEVNEALFFRLGQAIESEFLKGHQIIVGCDTRTSSASLKQSLIDGLVGAAAGVLDSGIAPTPVITWGSRQFGFVAAIVTASHNPANQNGLKLTRPEGAATDQDIIRLRDWAGMTRNGRQGSIEPLDLRTLYLDHIVDRWKSNLTRSRSYRFVLDPGNGAWSTMARTIFQRLGLDTDVIHGACDGKFQGRGPDCAAPGALSVLGAAVRHHGSAAGIAWDGDGDRVAVCDEQGNALSADQLALLLLPAIIPPGSRERVLVDVKMSRKVHETIEALGAVPVVEQSAHCMLQRRMVAETCIVGFECSGHVFFRELGGCDDGMYAALLLACRLSESREAVSTMVQRLPKMFITPDIRIPANTDEFQAIARMILQSFDPSQVSRVDGVKVEFPEGWFLIRQSVSENKLSLRFEGDSQADLDHMISLVKPMLSAQNGSMLSALTYSQSTQEPNRWPTVDRQGLSAGSA